MKRANLITFCLVIAALFIAGHAAAQSAGSLVGTWRTVSNVTLNSDGTRTENFGPKGTGMFIFAPDGRFVVVNINPDTPRFASNNRAQGTTEENKAAVLGGIGLFGTYSLSGNVLHMKVEGSTYPNWTGTDQTRNITFANPDEFKWTLAGSRGGTSEVAFKRIK